MTFRGLLDGKNILITGGGSGIGSAMAQQFSDMGASIAVLGRREIKLKETADLIKNKGGTAYFHTCDVRNTDQINEAIDYFLDNMKNIDILVNNAAGNFVSPTEKLSPHAFDSVVGIVLHGTFYVTLNMGKRWISNSRKGVVLDIVTTYAWTGSAFVVPSAAAKAGVLAMVRSLAVEWARYGIRHVAIAPGPFPTEATKRNLFPIQDMENKIIDRIPLGRTGRMEEISNLAAFLVSDYADYINGEVVTIDGGEWLKGAGQFNDFLSLDKDQWDLIREMSMKK